MPKRSKAEGLPKALKDWLDGELVRRGFADYEQLAAELKKQGADVSKSSLHRYGSKFEERMAQLKVSTEQARAVVSASPDDEGAMNEALTIRNRYKDAVRMLEQIAEGKISLGDLLLAGAGRPAAVGGVTAARTGDKTFGDLSGAL